MRISHFILPDAPKGTEHGICAVCGFYGDGQYLRDKVLDITTSNVTAIFELRYDHICAPCFGLWSKPKYWHRGILATTDNILFPVISEESKTEDRPTWSTALRSLGNGPRAAVLTTDPKKRVWPFARVSAGSNISLYIHDPSRGISENRLLTLSTLYSALDLIEDVYSLGFSKSQIASSLLTSQHNKRLELNKLLNLEARLQQIRALPEFVPALIIAQKEIIS
jgi:hypothetical protein